MFDTEVLDSILLPLADNYESGKTRVVTIDRPSVENFEPIRTTLAELCSEGYLCTWKGAGYCITPRGYLHFKARIDFLRSFTK